MSSISARTIFTQTERHATQSDKMKESGKECVQKKKDRRVGVRVRDVTFSVVIKQLNL